MKHLLSPVLIYVSVNKERFCDMYEAISHIYVEIGLNGF